jgi:antitoxin MazE
MKTHIVRIGNSRGVRIPKPLLEQTGWAAAFRKMAQNGDDALLDAVLPTLSGGDEDEREWR